MANNRLYLRCTGCGKNDYGRKTFWWALGYEKF